MALPRGIKQRHPLGSVASLSGVSQLSLVATPSIASTGVKISQLPPASAGTTTDQFEVNQGGVSRRLTLEQIRDLVSPEINVGDFGAVGDGVTDDTVALQAAIDAAYAAGGGVVDCSGGRYLIDSADLVIKDRVFLEGPLRNFGVPTWLAVFDYSNVKSALIVNSARTIMATGISGGIHGLAILRKGLTAPTDLASGQALMTSLASGGTAITLGDGAASGAGADFYLGHLFIAGFNYGIFADYADRYRIEYVNAHNWTEIYSVHAYDMGHINNCHFWPFLTAGQSWTLTGNAWRSYRGVFFDSGTDGTVVTDVFTYGKSVAFENTTDFVRYIGCWADNSSTGTYASTVGFQVSWPAKSTQLIGCSVSQHDNGVVIDLHATPYAGDTIFISGGSFADNVSNNILVTNGHAVISGCSIGNSTNGINIQAAAGATYYGNVFDGVTNPVVRASNASRLRTQAGHNIFLRCADTTIGYQHLSDGSLPQDEWWSFNATAVGPTYKTLHSRGSSETPAAAQTGDYASVFSANIYNGSGYTPVGSWRYQVAGVPSGTSSPGTMVFALTNTGATASTDLMQINFASLTPASNDGMALGTTALKWSDLHLASGGVINWNNGTATITQNSTTITLSGVIQVTDGTDYAARLLVAGTTKAIRFGTDSTGSSIEGVDNTGFGSFQPLTLGGSAVNVSVPPTVRSTTAVAAGANTQAFIKASSTANLGLYYGTGNPAFSAAKGSLYTKTDATTTTTRLWVNTDGSTTWTNFTSAA